MGSQSRNVDTPSVSRNVFIEWDYSGVADPLCGTGATSSERFLAYAFATLQTVFILALDMLRANPVASGWKRPVLAFFAFDIAGGAAANMLNSCKRYYHSPVRPGEGVNARLVKNVHVFTAVHVQPIVAAYLLGGNVTVAVVWYLLLQVSVMAVLAVPLYLRRAFATGIVIIAILLHESLLPFGDGLAWFIPCLFIKMVLAHAVQEEPYRPR